MTWSAAKKAGSEAGALEFELIIEGWPESFGTGGLETGVATQWTESDTITTHDARVRKPGLRHEPNEWTLRETGRLAEGMPDLEGFSVTIDDIDQEATASFTRTVSKSRTVDEAVGVNETTIDVGLVILISAGDIWYLGQEAIGIESTGTFQITVVRGILGSQQLQYLSKQSDQLTNLRITDAPVFLQGRRAELHAYGPSETGLSSAVELGNSDTLVWRGVVRDEPRQSGALTYRIGIDPITKVLEQDIGEVLEDKIKLRGVHYPAPLVLEVVISVQSTDSTIQNDKDKATRTLVVLGGADNTTKFWDNQDDFITDLNTELNSKVNTDSTDGFGGTTAEINAEKGPGGVGWQLVYHADETNPHACVVLGGSYVDGVTAHSGQQGSEQLLDKDLGTVTHVEAEQQYIIPWSGQFPRDVNAVNGIEKDDLPDDARMEPRRNSIMFDPGRQGLQLVGDKTARVDNLKTIFVERPELLTSGDSLVGEDDYSFIDKTISSISLSDGKLTLATELHTPLTQANAPKVALNMGTGDLSTFVDNLLTRSEERSSTGMLPRLSNNDIDKNEVSSVVANAASEPFQTSRIYTLREGKKLSKILAHEARLIGCFWRMTDTGALGLQRLGVAADTAGPFATDITSDNVRTDFGRVVPSADGIINIVKVERGWDPEDGEFKDGSVTARKINSLSTYGKRRTLEIAPTISTDTNRVVPTSDQVRQLAENIWEVFGSSYRRITFGVTMAHFDTLVGDTVKVTVPQAPYEGGRKVWGSGGVDQVIGVVTAREWTLPEGKLTIHAVDAKIQGYAPAVRVESASDNGDSTWTFTVSTGTKYAPSGATDVSFFSEGDIVHIYPLDDDARLVAKGKITSLDTSTGSTTVDFTNTDDVEFVGMAGLTWIMHYGNQTETDERGNAAQFDYAGVVQPSNLRPGDREKSTFA